MRTFYLLNQVKLCNIKNNLQIKICNPQKLIQCAQKMNTAWIWAQLCYTHVLFLLKLPRIQINLVVQAFRKKELD